MNYFPLWGGVITDDANATASQILSGYTAYVKGKKITGTIPSQGAQTITPGTSNKTIASGRYLSGTQTIKGDSNLVAGNIKAGTSIFGVSGTFTSDGNAGIGDIRSGKTAYVNGNKVTGSLVSRDTGTPNWCENVRLANGRFEIAPPAGIHGCWWDGGQYSYMSYEQVRNAIGLTADKLAYDVSILGIKGNKKNISSISFTASYSGGTNASEKYETVGAFWGSDLFVKSSDSQVQCVNRGHGIQLMIQVTTSNVNPNAWCKFEVYVNNYWVYGKQEGEMIQFNGTHWFNTGSFWISPNEKIRIKCSYGGGLYAYFQISGLFLNY